jgi:hypothetical protein
VKRRGPMDKNRITRPTRPDARATDCEVQSSKIGVVDAAASGESGRSYLGRSALCPGFGTEVRKT